MGEANSNLSQQTVVQLIKKCERSEHQGGYEKFVKFE